MSEADANELARQLIAHTRPLLDDAIRFRWSLPDLVAIAYLRGALDVKKLLG